MLGAKRLSALYRRPRRAEPFNRSLKQKMSLGKSLARMRAFRADNFLFVLCSFTRKLLKLVTKVSHFAAKSKCYVRMPYGAGNTLCAWQTGCLAE